VATIYELTKVKPLEKGPLCSSLKGNLRSTRRDGPFARFDSLRVQLQVLHTLLIVCFPRTSFGQFCRFETRVQRKAQGRRLE